jgi:spore coat polysaccharide biosynthesis protein SpsF
MKIVAVIQVRIGSTRLPGKVMKEVVGKPVLELLIERLRHSKLINKIVVATTGLKKDDIIVDLCRKLGIDYFRGSEDDVMGRVLGALKQYGADAGVEIYGDCPLIDPAIVDSIIQYYIMNIEKYDFVSNDIKTTYPPGLETEVYSVSAFADAADRTSDPEIREHSTLYMRQHPELYRLHNIEAQPELHYPDIYIELDTPEDFRVIKTIYESLYSEGKIFSAQEILDFLKQNPHIAEQNRRVERRWKKYRKEEDV